MSKHVALYDAQRVKSPAVEVFSTGATREDDTNKLDYEGFLSPLVIERYAKYVHKHRIQPDGKLRDSDNWQRGIPLWRYIKSAWRHFWAWWTIHRGYKAYDEKGNPIDLEEAICGTIFNSTGYLHEILKVKYKKGSNKSGGTKNV